MPRCPKFLYHGSIHFVTTSVEEGLMLPPNRVTQELVRKSMAQAQNLYPVTICGYLVEATHVHFILQTIDPTDFTDFIERFKK